MLIEFYGEECHFCNMMKPLVARLEKEEGVKFTKYETWHSDANEKIRQQYDKNLCGGVPFFMNTKTDKFICGAVSYEDFKQWALS